MGIRSGEKTIGQLAYDEAYACKEAVRAQVHGGRR